MFQLSLGLLAFNSLWITLVGIAPGSENIYLITFAALIFSCLWHLPYEKKNN